MRGTFLMTEQDMDRFIELFGNRIAQFLAPAGGVHVRA
jgi:hypothetical protein